MITLERVSKAAASRRCVVGADATLAAIAADRAAARFFPQHMDEILGFQALGESRSGMIRSRRMAPPESASQATHRAGQSWPSQYASGSATHMLEQ